MRPEARPTIAQGFRLQWEEAQQRDVLLYPEGIIQLSESAAEILKRCDGSRSAASVVADLKATYPEADLEQDVYEFLEVASANGWIREQ